MTLRKLRTKNVKAVRDRARATAVPQRVRAGRTLFSPGAPTDIVAEMTYRTEEDLVLEFMAQLANQTELPAHGVTREFVYQRGRTDVVSVSACGEIAAFEAKLTRWRDALVQAYRNTCFAHRSYVVLPAGTAERAGRCAGEFTRRGVGLCAMGIGGALTIVLPATRAEPLQPFLSQAAFAAATGAGRSLS